MSLEERLESERDPTRRAALAAALARRFRMEMLDILHEKQTGHWGGASSACELVTALYFHRLAINPREPRRADRDRFILSKGHASLLLYTVLAHRGFFDPALLGGFRDLGSSLQGHPCMNKVPGVDMSTGALGHGLSVGLGMALASRLARKDWKTYVMTGEGCLNEGQSWEALMCAAKYRAPGLTLMVDLNGVQLDGTSADIMPMEPLAEKLRAFGWLVLPGERDGHDMAAILRSFEELDGLPAWPKAVIYRTVKGKGVSFMEGKNAWHGSPVDDESYARARPELAAAYESALALAGLSSAEVA
jgi:transketolase